MAETYLNITPTLGSYEGDYVWLYGNSILSVDGSIAYVAGETFKEDHQNVRSGVFAIDVATGEIVDLWVTGRWALTVSDISPDGRYLLINSGQFGGTLILDLETGGQVTVGDYSHDGSTFYSDMIMLGNGTAMLFDADEVYFRAPLVVDLATGATSYFDTKFRGGATVTASADRSLLLVSSLGNDLTLIRVGEGVIATGIGSNNGIHAISAAGDIIVNGSDLSVYDGQLNRLFSLQDRIASLDDVVGATFSADGSKLYVLNGARDSVEIVDTSDWSLIASVPAGTGVKDGGDYLFLIPDNLLQVGADDQYLTVKSDEGVIRIDLSTAAPGIGTGGNDMLIGGAGNDTLYGLAGNDHLDGGAGADRMSGGVGNDTYVVDNAGDIVIEKVGAGFDTVNTSISYALTDNVESLRLIGVTGAVDAHGNAGNNWLNAVWVNVAPAAGTHIRLYGEGGNDNLQGSRYDDYLDGGTGVDTMIGGFGNDTYVVDNAGDLVIEQAGGGFDTVNSSISYSLTDNVESLRFIGVTSAVDGYGNAGNNWLNAAWVNVAPAAGTEIRLFGAGGDDNLLGSRYNDYLDGGDGTDYLDGGGGADRMAGGRGNDTYIVDNVGDVVIERPGEGFDTVNVSFSYRLTDNVESLRFIGVTGAVDGYGNAGNNWLNAAWVTVAPAAGTQIKLFGEGGNDSLLGSRYSDFLDGGAGNDTLQGGDGNDRFHFGDALSALSNVDTILDFQRGDVIELDDAVFRGLSTGALGAGAFVANAAGAATSAEQRIVYDTDSGQLFFDADGSGAGGAVLFAVLTGHPAIGAADFVVV